MEFQRHHEINREFLFDKRVCVTGRFVSMTHEELAALVRAGGGQFRRNPPRGAAMLVVGEEGWPAQHDGSPTATFERARRLRAYGYPIEFLSESEFFEKVGLVKRTEAIRGPLTIADLAGILKLSSARIRAWIRMGLITPTKTVHRFCYFDFHQVSGAKRLCELIAEGARLSEIRAGLEQIRRWLPRRELPFSQLASLEHDGRLLARVCGNLVEPGGQRRFDFDSASDQGIDTIPVVSRSADVDQLFDEALCLEDAGRLEEAAQVYGRGIEREPSDPVCHFNLGNVLFALGRIEAAVQSYRHAIQRDPHYAEAWNNLGNTHRAMEAWPDAIAAFRRAIQLVPDYADARHNLRDALNRPGWNVSTPPNGTESCIESND